MNQEMKETMERVDRDNFYEKRGKGCWYCDGEGKCECSSCGVLLAGAKPGKGKCRVCNAKPWTKVAEEKANAPQANAIAARKKRDMIAAAESDPNYCSRPSEQWVDGEGARQRPFWK